MNLQTEITIVAIFIGMAFGVYFLLKREKKTSSEINDVITKFKNRRYSKLGIRGSIGEVRYRTASPLSSEVLDALLDGVARAKIALASYQMNVSTENRYLNLSKLVFCVMKEETLSLINHTPSLVLPIRCDNGALRSNFCRDPHDPEARFLRVSPQFDYDDHAAIYNPDIQIITVAELVDVATEETSDILVPIVLPNDLSKPENIALLKNAIINGMEHEAAKEFHPDIYQEMAQPGHSHPRFGLEGVNPAI